MRPDVAHPDHTAMRLVWRKMRDVLDGQRSVKHARDTYLPRLDAQSTHGYDAYLQRADFYPATGRTMLGLIGMIFRKPSATTVPDVVARDVTAHLRDVTLSGMSAEGFALSVVAEMLAVGRGYVLVSYHEKANRPFWRRLEAEHVINWRTARNPVSGDVEYTMIVYNDVETSADPEDPFLLKHERVIRTVRMVPSDDVPPETHPFGVCVAETFKHVRRVEAQPNTASLGGEWQLASSERLTKLGVPLAFVPVVGFNAYNLDVAVEPPPLEPLADLNLSHYRTSADLEHGAHYVAMPTPYVTGYQGSETLYIGASSAWTIASPDARVGMLEFSGQGLGALETRLESKQQLMATIGARMLEQRTRAAETAEALRLRQGESTSALEQVAATASDALSYVLWLHCWWMMTTEPRDEDVSFSVNRDFIDAHLSGADLREMVSAWQEGAFSWDTLFYNLSKGNIIPPNVEKDDEQARVEVEKADRSAIAMEIAGGRFDAGTPRADDGQTQNMSGGA